MGLEDDYYIFTRQQKMLEDEDVIIFSTLLLLLIAFVYGIAWRQLHHIIAAHQSPTSGLLTPPASCLVFIGR